MNEWHRLTVKSRRACRRTRSVASTSTSSKRRQREMKIVGVLPAAQHRQHKQGGVKWTATQHARLPARCRLDACRCSVVNFHKLHISAMSAARLRYYTIARGRRVVNSRTTRRGPSAAQLVWHAEMAERLRDAVFDVLLLHDARTKGSRNLSDRK